MSWFAELKRRNVYRVAVAYLVVSWGLIEVADILIGVLGLPDWAQRLILVLLLIGFLPTLIAAWALELTPDGIKREKDVDRSRPEYRNQGRTLDFIIIGALSMIIAMLLVERLYFADTSEPVVAETEVLDIERSVAVLPFDDLSQESDQEWFADGLSEEIINALARTPDVQVAARTSTRAYRNTEKDVSTIGRELGVAHVLEGSIRTSGDSIRVTAQLIRVSDGFHLWSQTYDHSMEDVIGIQEDVAIRIASALDTTMNPDALQDMMIVGTRSVRAYQAYIRGVALRAYSWRTADSQYFLDAYEQFEIARRIDPKFSTAHRQAADFWRIQLNPAQINSGLVDEPPSVMYRNFLERINLAVDTANNDVDRSGSRAQRASVQLRYRNAIRRFREYLDARPNDLGTWADLLRVAMVVGDEDVVSEALGVLQSAADRNRTAATLYLGFAYLLIDVSEAADFGLKALERWPNDAGIAYQTHRSLLWATRVDEAARLLARIDPILTEESLIAKARQACAEGRREDVLDILETMRSSETYSITEDWLILMMLDEQESARLLLDSKVSDEVPYQLAAWLVYPTFDPGAFPILLQMLERENIERPPPIPITFACPANP